MILKCEIDVDNYPGTRDELAKEISDYLNEKKYGNILIKWTHKEHYFSSVIRTKVPEWWNKIGR